MDGDGHRQPSTGAAADADQLGGRLAAPPFIAAEADRTAFLMFS